MIDIGLGEMLEIAREAELQRRLEADGVAPAGGKPVTIPEDLRGKLGVASERGKDDPSPSPPQPGN